MKWYKTSTFLFGISLVVFFCVFCLFAVAPARAFESFNIIATSTPPNSDIAITYPVVVGYYLNCCLFSGTNYVLDNLICTQEPDHAFALDNSIPVFSQAGCGIGMRPIGYYTLIGKNDVSASCQHLVENSDFEYLTTFYWDGIVPVSSSTSDITLIPFVACDNLKPANILDVAGGVQYAFCNISHWLFFPSSISLAKFQGLGDTFQTKAPFAYFYTIAGGFDSLSPTSTPAFSLNASSTGALNTSIFQPIKIGLTWILWLMFGIFCIKRIAKFDF